MENMVGHKQPNDDKVVKGRMADDGVRTLFNVVYRR